MKPSVVPYFFCCRDFNTFVPSFIIGKLSLEKNAIKPRLLIEILNNLDIG